MGAGRRGLAGHVVGLLTALLVGAYLALVWAFGQLLPWDERTSGLVAAAVLALGVQPLRSWMQVRVDRLVYGADAGTLLARFGDSARTQGLAGLAQSFATTCGSATSRCAPARTCPPSGRRRVSQGHGRPCACHCATTVVKSGSS